MLKRMSIFVLCVTLLFSLTACSNTKPTVEKEGTRTKMVEDDYPDPDRSPKLEIQPGVTFDIDDDNYISIKGSVKNIGNEDISYFEVRADFLSDTGQILDSGYTNDGLLLKPNAMRSFEITHKWEIEYGGYSLSTGGLDYR